MFSLNALLPAIFSIALNRRNDGEKINKIKTKLNKKVN